MLAAWYDEVGSAREVLKVGELDTPIPGAGEVLVKLGSSGINPSDVKTRAGLRGPMAFPQVIPHSDGAGTIEAVGAGVDDGRIGERVWIYNAAWKRPFGSAAEYVSLPAEQTAPLPESVSFDAGACLGIPAMSAHACVFASGEVEGKHVLVTGGAGAVGHYAIQLAKWGGAHVLATVSGEKKARHAREAGSDVVINYRQDNVVGAVKDATDGHGVDLVVEVEFGGNLDVTRQILRPHATVAAYGSMAAPTPELPFYEFMFAGIAIRTILVYILTEPERRRAIEDIGRCLESGQLRHNIAATFPLTEIAAAHEAVERGDLIGNVVLSIA